MIALLALACGHPETTEVATSPEPAAHEAPVSSEPGCAANYAFPDGQSVLEEQRSKGTAWPDFPTGYAAAPVDPSMTPVAAVAKYTFDGAPMLWFSADHATATVDSRVFSDLTAVDVPKLAPGESKIVGTIRADAAPKLAPRTIVEFLLSADALRTYWHIGSALCLVKDGPANGGYEAEFTGHHTYFTNSKHESALSFVVDIGADGTIAVAGR